MSSNESTEGMKEGIPEKKDNIKPSESLKYHNAPVEIPNLPSSHAENQSSGLDAEATDDINETRAGPTAINFDGSAGYKIAHPTRTLYYPNLDKCLSLESDLQVNVIYFKNLNHILMKRKTFFTERISYHLSFGSSSLSAL